MIFIRFFDIAILNMGLQVGEQVRTTRDDLFFDIQRDAAVCYPYRTPVRASQACTCYTCRIKVARMLSDKNWTMTLSHTMIVKK
jgi:hypothetical protein